MGHKEGSQYALEFANSQLILSGEEILQGKLSSFFTVVIHQHYMGM